MNRKIKYLILVIATFLVSTAIVLNFISIFKEKRIDMILDTHSNKIETYYNVLSYNQKIDADIIYKETVKNKELIEIFKKALTAKRINNTVVLNKLRSDAKKLLDEKYELYKQKGVLQYHFVFPDNKVFLRMHKPSKFADDLSEVREDFAYVNRSLKIVRGFAQGRTAHAFRNVYPLLDQDQNHLGAFEVSFSSEHLQNYFTKVNKIHTHFLVRKDIFKSHTWKRDDLILKYQPSSEHSNYMITMTSDHSVNKCIIENNKRIEDQKANIAKNIANKKKFSIYTVYKDKARVASFYPILHNITKEPVAWIVSYTQEPLIDETLKTQTILFIFSFVILAIVFSFIYLILIQKDVLKLAVEEKTKHLSRLNRDLEESEHELEVINENLEHKVKEELEKNRNKDKILFEQTKMAALGEMIGNIAHQWRQPLSVISTSASAMVLQNEMDILEKEKISDYGNNINKNAQYLSKTIDDFRNFIRGNSIKERFNLSNSFKSFLNLVETSRKKYQIKIIIDVDKDLEITGLKNELNQCLINLFNNSKDIFNERDVKNKYIKIKTIQDQKDLSIVFYDNGGGIKEEIMDKIFEPYFTTKHQSIGTGLGLNMTYRLITEGMGGTITVSNDSFSVGDEKFYGAKFIITIPDSLKV